MAQTAITFTQDANGNWKHSFTSAGKVAVQLNCAKAGRVLVFATFGTLEDALVGELDNAYNNCMFELDYPEGATVTITSTTEVTQALMQDA